MNPPVEPIRQPDEEHMTPEERRAYVEQQVLQNLSQNELTTYDLAGDHPLREKILKSLKWIGIFAGIFVLNAIGLSFDEEVLGLTHGVQRGMPMSYSLAAVGFVVVTIAFVYVRLRR